MDKNTLKVSNFSLVTIAPLLSPPIVIIHILFIYIIIMLGLSSRISRPFIKSERKYTHCTTYNRHCRDPQNGEMAEFDHQSGSHSFLFHKFGVIQDSRIVADLGDDGKTKLFLEISPSHGDLAFKHYNFGFLKDFTADIFHSFYLPVMDNIVDRLVIFCILYNIFVFKFLNLIVYFV